MQEFRGDLAEIRKFYSEESEAKLKRKMFNDARGMTRQGFQLVRTVSKIGRNEPCPCGSGEKFKRCHIDSCE